MRPQSVTVEGEPPANSLMIMRHLSAGGHLTREGVDFSQEG
jgi:hypothetical protein